MLDQAAIPARLTLPPDQEITHPESAMVRTLYECPDHPLEKSGEKRSRDVGATHPAGAPKSRIGVTRDGVVYELFLTTLPSAALTAADVVALSLHRGSLETTLADEDREHDPDRWWSPAAWGQEAWQVSSPWVWKLRLELGHHLHPDPVRTTACAPASDHPTPASGYAPAQAGSPWKAGRFSGRDVALQPNGTLRCLAGQSLALHERRAETNGSLRLVSGASIHHCRPCPLRQHCQWEGNATTKPRPVRLMLHPLALGAQPLLWRDWSRRFSRRACMQVGRNQRLEVELHPSLAPPLDPSPAAFSRAPRAHSRRTFQERLARNQRPPTAGQGTITLFGVPCAFATFLGLRSTYPSRLGDQDGLLSLRTGVLFRAESSGPFFPFFILLPSVSGF